MFVPLISIEDLLYSVEISGSYSQFVISGGFGWVIQLYIDQWRYYLSWSNNGSNHCCRTDLTTTDSNFKMTATPSLDVLSPRHDDQKVDLAFVIDCTQLMDSYIRRAQRRISTISKKISRSVSDVRLALVEYRDHLPKDRSFVTKVHNFTSLFTVVEGAWIFLWS